MQAIAQFISTLLSLYSFIIVIRIFLSWGGLGASRFGGFYSFITKVTDPYLNIFRRFPGMQRGVLDFSPVLAMIVLGIVNNMFTILAEQGRITLGIILALIVQAIGSVLSFFITIFIILFAIRLLLEYRQTPNSIQYISILDNLLSGMQSRVHRLIYRGREVPTRNLLVSSIITFIVVQILFRVLIRWLTGVFIDSPI